MEPAIKVEISSHVSVLADPIMDGPDVVVCLEEIRRMSKVFH